MRGVPGPASYELWSTCHELQTVFCALGAHPRLMNNTKLMFTYRNVRGLGDSDKCTVVF